MAFQILSGKGVKSLVNVINSCSLAHSGIQSLPAVYAKSIAQNQ
jgi:hypothetical protein